MRWNEDLADAEVWVAEGFFVRLAVAGFDFDGGAGVRDEMDAPADFLAEIERDGGGVGCLGDRQPVALLQL
jgi:hypothetical protein